MSRLSGSAARVSAFEANARLAALLADVNRGAAFPFNPEIRFPLLPLPTAPGVQPANSAPAATGHPQNLPALQRVNPGDTIRSADFNALVDTVKQLADLLGVKPQPGRTTVSVYPVFFPVHNSDGSTDPAWLHRRRAAYVPPGGAAAGFIPVQLPDGMQILSLSVAGEKPDSAAGHLGLYRLPIAGERDEILLPKHFFAEEPIDEPVDDPTGNDPKLRVNNDKYSYFLWSQVRGVAGMTMYISGIKITLAG